MSIVPFALLGSLAVASPSSSMRAAGLTSPMSARRTFRPSFGGLGESTIYAFLGQPDGGSPQSELIADSTGALYGTTEVGGPLGAVGFGTVFKLTPTPSAPSGYVESILYNFQGGNDGAFPRTRLILDSSGNFYGTTSGGGNAGFGTIFKLTPGPSGYTESVLYAFQGGNDGRGPTGPVVEDAAGALYGAAVGGSDVEGLLFKLTPQGSSYVQSVIHTFGAFGDGASPVGGLVLDQHGALYGSTVQGGKPDDGTVYKLTPMGSVYVETILYAFHGGNDGANPFGGLIAHGQALYGTTEAGGTANLGTVFKVTPAESVLYSFQGGTDGEFPVADVIVSKSGAIFGTTEFGGGANDGTVFKLAPTHAGYRESVLYSFQGGANDGAFPVAGLLGEANVLIGTTPSGGSSACTNGCGNVFEVQTGFKPPAERRR
jgi:uncharacterized repeat protein (TIGR03803 family)